MRTLREVVAEINGWNDVAEELTARGIKGFRSKCHSCPIAVYVGRETGNYFYVSVFGMDVIATIQDGSRTEREWLSSHVQEFIDEFDQGLYPQLASNVVV